MGALGWLGWIIIGISILGIIGIIPIVGALSRARVVTGYFKASGPFIFILLVTGIILVMLSSTYGI